jgi:hypothetical protein
LHPSTPEIDRPPRKLLNPLSNGFTPSKATLRPCPKAVVSVLIDPRSVRCSNEPFSEYTTTLPDRSAALRRACSRGEEQSN